MSRFRDGAPPAEQGEFFLDEGRAGACPSDTVLRAGHLPPVRCMHCGDADAAHAAQTCPLRAEEDGEALLAPPLPHASPLVAAVRSAVCTPLVAAVAAASGLAHSVFLTHPPAAPLVGRGQTAHAAFGCKTAMRHAQPAALHEWPHGVATAVAATLHETAVIVDDALMVAGSRDAGIGASVALGEPRLVPLPGKAKPAALAAGDEHLLILEADGGSGRVFALGSDRFGQLGVGLGSEHARAAAPTIVHHLDNEHVVAIRCGDVTSSAITCRGGLFAWGRNDARMQALCKEDGDRITTPLHVPLAFAVADIAWGGTSVVVLSRVGHVWIGNAQQPTLAKLALPGIARAVRAGGEAMAAIMHQPAEPALLVWGRDSDLFGHLPFHTQETPAPLEDDSFLDIVLPRVGSSTQPLLIRTESPAPSPFDLKPCAAGKCPAEKEIESADQARRAMLAPTPKARGVASFLSSARPVATGASPVRGIFDSRTKRVTAEPVASADAKRRKLAAKPTNPFRKGASKPANPFRKKASNT